MSTVDTSNKDIRSKADAKKPGKRILMLSDILLSCDRETVEHSFRTGEYSVILFEEYLKNNPTELDYGSDTLYFAAVLHDIGKSSIPISILMKPSVLTADETEVIRKHPVSGDEILKVLLKSENQILRRVCREAVLYHHERYDGGGYPDGLKGDDIPLPAQIIGAASCFDSLTSVRSYRTAFDKATAIKMIKTGKCGKFSTKITQIISCLE